MRISCTVILSFLMSPLMAQVEVILGVSQDTVVIGDDVEVILSIDRSDNTPVLGVSTFFLDSIYSALQTTKAHVDTSRPAIPKVADFEIIANDWKDEDGDGYYDQEELHWTDPSAALLEKRFRVKLWDPGPNLIVAPTVVIPSGDTVRYISPERGAEVYVAAPQALAEKVDSLQVAPIKTIKEESANITDFFWLIGIVGVMLLLGLGYWLYQRYQSAQSKKHTKVEIPKVLIPAHLVALDKLKSLGQKNLWEAGQIKDYQSELTYIVREYLENRYNIPALESTTKEIVESLSKVSFDPNDLSSLQRILQIADLVKFAKATPESNMHQAFMDDSVDFVHRTKDEHVKVLLAEGEIQHQEFRMSADAAADQLDIDSQDIDHSKMTKDE